MEQTTADTPSRLARIAKSPAAGQPLFTICTIVTNPDEYAQMRQSFAEHGFTDGTTTFLFADNSNGNAFDAYEAYNIFLSEARSRYIILCHQDIVLLEDGYRELVAALEELNSRFPSWGLCGNAGAGQNGVLSVRISDPHVQNNAEGGPFPVPVVALDENFIVVRRDANLAVSHDMSGFHLYGADLCIIADVLGRTAYVIDFHLLHKSGGKLDGSFYDTRDRLAAKYRRAMRPRWIEVTTRQPFFVSGSPVSSRLAKVSRAIAWRTRRYRDAVRRLTKA